ncbi:MAG: hypothetical protein HQ518_07800 [Rhodopirellula sp.]|nr:hypothetical protein [Rhodopirellula sp.]
MMKRILIMRLIVVIVCCGASGERLDAQVVRPGVVSSVAVREDRAKLDAARVNRPAVKADDGAAGCEVDCSCRVNKVAGTHSLAGAAFPVRMDPAPLSVAERFWLWLAVVILLPWLLGSLLQSVLRQESMLLESALLLCWMAVVVASSWAFWGAGLPVIVFAALSVPALGGAMPYFAFVMDRLDPVSIHMRRA